MKERGREVKLEYSLLLMKKRQSDEAIKEVKKISKVVKVVKEKPSSGFKSSKESKPSELDEALKKGKLEVEPPMSLNEIVNEVIKNVNLKPLLDWYDNFDENGEKDIRRSYCRILECI